MRYANQVISGELAKDNLVGCPSPSWEHRRGTPRCTIPGCEKRAA